MPEQTFQRVLGFDYGKKRIGMATGSSFSGNAQGLKTIDNIQTKPNWTLIDQTITQWRPNGLIVGLPLDMQGETTALSQLATEFGRQLKKRYKLPVIMVDERLSSSEADYLLRQQHQIAGRKPTSMKKKRVQSRDSIAAQLIIETYFSQPHDFTALT